MSQRPDHPLPINPLLRDADACRGILRLAAGEADATARKHAVHTLGRLGDPDDLPGIERMVSQADGSLRRAAAFARLLLVHRHDLPDTSAPVEPFAPWRPASGTTRVGFSPASRATLVRSAGDLAHASVGAGLDDRRGWALTCFSSQLLLLFPRDLPTGQELAKRKALFAMVAKRDEASGRWHDAYLVLTAPANEGGRVHGGVYRPSGRRVAQLDAVFRDETYHFELTGLRRRGAFPLLLAGMFRHRSEMTLQAGHVAPSSIKRRVSRRALEFRG